MKLKLFLASLVVFVLVSVGFELGLMTPLFHPPPPYYWTLPARFEHDGAVTLGCAFWDPPIQTDYSADNPDSGLWMLSADYNSGALVVVDGPNGTALLNGTNCAISIDWNAFPRQQRPAPTEPPAMKGQQQ